MALPTQLPYLRALLSKIESALSSPGGTFDESALEEIKNGIGQLLSMREQYGPNTMLDPALGRILEAYGQATGMVPEELANAAAQSASFTPGVGKVVTPGLAQALAVLPALAAGLTGETHGFNPISEKFATEGPAALFGGGGQATVEGVGQAADFLSFLNQQTGLLPEGVGDSGLPDYAQQLVDRLSQPNAKTTLPGLAAIAQLTTGPLAELSGVVNMPGGIQRFIDLDKEGKLTWQAKELITKILNRFAQTTGYAPTNA